MDERGYDTFWMAEHHFQPEGTELIPNGRTPINDRCYPKEGAGEGDAQGRRLRQMPCAMANGRGALDAALRQVPDLPEPSPRILEGKPPEKT
jgi:hypothetical protein